MAIVEVVKYNGSPDFLAWKYPNEELGTWTQLIVNESQEAILFKGGKALDIFGSGRHTLETANIPILSKLVNIPFGGRSPFTAEVWYVNKLFDLDVKWGTASPIQLQDPKYNIIIPVRAFGQFGIQVEDSKKFILKLVGTMSTFDKKSMINYFRGLYLTKVKDLISTYLVKHQISILEINAYLEEISDELQGKMVDVLKDYGIKLVSFYVNDISVPDDDSAVVRLKNALSKKAEMDIIGFDYQQERSFDTLEGAATNPNSIQGNMMGAGMRIGMGFGMGGAVGAQFSGIANNISTQVEIKKCPKCNADMNKNTRFCGECGHDTQDTSISKEKKSEVKCADCGASLNKNAKFCPECGKKYNSCPNCKGDMPEGATVCPVCNESLPMKCPGCGSDILKKGAKFCSECGMSLVKNCSNCGTAIEGEQKFCLECGNKLS